MARTTGAQLMFFFCFRCPVVLFDDLLMSSRLVACPRLCFFIVFNLNLFDNRKDALSS